MIKVITVNYKQKNYIQKLVDSLDKNAELYIVDNSGELVNKKFDQTTILNPGKNIGYLHGLVFGTKMIEIKNDDFVIWTNPDITFAKGFFDILKKNTGNNYEMLAPRIINSKGQDQNPNMLSQASRLRIALYDIEFSSYLLFVIVGAIKIFLKSLLNRNKLEKIDYKLRQKIFQGHGACMIFNGIFFSYPKDFDYNIFIWGEEAVIANEVRKRGGAIIYDPSLIVFHDEGSITSIIPTRERFIQTSKSYKIYRKYLRYNNLF